MVRYSTATGTVLFYHDNLLTRKTNFISVDLNLGTSTGTYVRTV